MIAKFNKYFENKTLTDGTNMPYEVGTIIVREPKYNGNSEYFELVKYINYTENFSNQYQIKYYLHEYEAYPLKSNLKEVKGAKVNIKLYDINSKDTKIVNNRVYVMKQAGDKLVSQSNIDADNRRSTETAIELNSDKPYLMTKAEYKKKITPILKQYVKFIDANDKYFKRSYGKLAGKTAEEYGENSHEYKYTFKEKYDTPVELINKRNVLEKEIENILGRNISQLLTDDVNSNKQEIRRANDSGLYEELLKNNVINIKNLESIFAEASLKVPKKYYDIDKNIKELGITKEVELSVKEQQIEFVENLKKYFKEVYDSKVKGYYNHYSNSLEKYETFMTDKKYNTISEIAWYFTIYTTGEKPRVEIYTEKGTEKKKIYYSPDSYVAFDSKLISKEGELNKNWKIDLQNQSIEYANVVFELYGSRLITYFAAITPIEYPIVTGGSLYKNTPKGFNSDLFLKYKNGFEFMITTDLIWAGGYNIQVEHIRGLFKFFYKGKNVSSADIAKEYNNYKK
jgi:hypothetical protein